MQLVELLVYYLIAINFAAFAAFGLDKARAEAGAWRIRESTLHSLAFFGGLPGAYAGRAAFRHKTRKKDFTHGLHLIGAFQIGLVGLYLFGVLDRFVPPEQQDGTLAFAATEAVPHPGDLMECDALWAAGQAPVYRGQPGYRADRDGDGDGISCENPR